MRVRGEKTKKIIRNVSALSFAVYLISENSNIWPLLWTEVFQTRQFYTSDYFLLHFLVSTIIVYLICTMIEFARKKMIFPLFAHVYHSFRNIKEYQ